VNSTRDADNLVQPDQTPPGQALPGAQLRRAEPPAGRCVLVLVVLCLGLFLLNADTLPLADPEESRCALVVRGMLARGDWIVPRLEGKVYYEKPAPFFWLAGMAEQLTGSGELAGRLVAALAGAVAVLITFAVSRRVFGNLAGLVGGVVLATSGEFLFLARWYRMDMPFTASLWAAVWWFWRSEFGSQAPPPAGKRWRWVGFYFFCAVATLLKGPAGLVLPVLIVGVYFLLSGQSRRIGEMFNPLGMGAFLAVALPWYVAVGLEEPRYLYEFLVMQNLGRYTGGYFRHRVPGLIYIPVLLAGMLPWSVYLPGAVIRYFPRRWRLRAQRPAVLLLWLAAVLVVLFFAFSGTKLVAYVLPAFPPLAALVGALLGEWIASDRQDGLMTAGARAMIVTLPVTALAVAGLETWLQAADAWIAALAGATVLAVWGMIVCLRRGRRHAFFAWSGAGAVSIFVFMILHTAPAGYDLISARSFARLIGPEPAPKGRLCYWGDPRLSFQYYFPAAEMTEGHYSDANRLPELARLLSADQPTYCLVTGEAHLRQLESACPMVLETVAHLDEMWLVRNPRRQGHGR
jgi:4-amino-4-deoxy-L-arabinose transferase-like glycosyltransferase